MTKARTLADNFAADINQVDASAPLTGGGTSGTVTVGIQDATTSQKGAVQLEDSTASTSTTKAATPNSVKSAYDLADGAIAKSLVDAKGDLLAGSADNTLSRLAVGANDTVLTADSSTSTGLKWASASTPFSGCEVYLTSSYTLPTATLYIVSFTSENYDTDAYHDNSTNPTRLTVPSTGYYLINAGCVLSATGSQVEIRIRRNGADVKHNSEEGSVYSYAFSEAHCVLYMTSGQYLEMTVYHNKGSDATLFSGSYFTWFNIARLG